MAKVKLFNDNEHPFVDPDFKGIKIEIPAKGWIEMDFEEAVELKGKFSPIVWLSEGNPDPRFFKKLRHEWPKPEVAKIEYVDPVTGKRYDTAAQLSAALRAHEHLQVTDEEAERALGAAPRVNPEIEALRAEIAALTKIVSAQTEKKGPGRPKKVSNE